MVVYPLSRIYIHRRPFWIPVSKTLNGLARERRLYYVPDRQMDVQSSQFSCSGLRSRRGAALRGVSDADAQTGEHLRLPAPPRRATDDAGGEGIGTTDSCFPQSETCVREEECASKTRSTPKDTKNMFLQY